MLLRSRVVVIRRVLVALVLSVFVGVTAIAQATPAWAAQYDVITTIPVGNQADGVAVSPDGTKAYVANRATNTISVINTTTDKVTATIPVGMSPSDLAVSPDGTKVYTTNFNDNRVSVINTTTNVVDARITVGTGPFGVAFTPDGKKAYVTNYSDGTVTVINADTDSVIGGPITVGGQPWGVAVSPTEAKAYVANRETDNVSVINTGTNEVTATIPVGANPKGVAVSPDGTKAYVTNDIDNTVSVINTTTNEVTATIPVGTSPWGVAVSGNKAYVANEGSNNVSVINTTTNDVTATIPVGTDPSGVAVTPDGTTAYVPSFTGSVVSVIDLRAPASASADPGVPGIFLAVNDVLVGSQVTGAPIYYGADSIQPNSAYTLSIQSVTHSALTRTVLDSGSVNSRGHLDETFLLPEVNPGSYKIVMTGIHASGNLLVLTNFITIGANGGIVSVSPASQQPFLE